MYEQCIMHTHVHHPAGLETEVVRIDAFFDLHEIQTFDFSHIQFQSCFRSRDTYFLLVCVQDHMKLNPEEHPLPGTKSLINKPSFASTVPDGFWRTGIQTYKHAITCCIPACIRSYIHPFIRTFIHAYMIIHAYVHAFMHACGSRSKSDVRLLVSE